MKNTSLEAWIKHMGKIAPTPYPDEIYRMRWNGEWRYYKHLAYCNKNGKMWDRVTKNDYDEYRLKLESRKGLTLNDLLKDNI